MVRSGPFGLTSRISEEQRKKFKVEHRSAYKLIALFTPQSGNPLFLFLFLVGAVIRAGCCWRLELEVQELYVKGSNYFLLYFIIFFISRQGKIAIRRDFCYNIDINIVL